MPLINCKILLEINWNNDCVMYCADIYAGGDNANNRKTTFRITSTKLYVTIVILSTKEKIEAKEANANNLKRFPPDASFQGVNRLFVLDFDNINNGDNKVERNSHRKHFLPRVDITKYNVLIDGRNFYDQPINDQIKKYDEIRKIATGKGGDYTAGCLLDY